MTHTHTHGPTCRKGWLIPHLSVVILQLRRKMLLNEAGLEHPLKKSSCLVSFKHPAASAERIQQQLFKLKIKLKSVQSQTNSCISINISIYWKFEIETTSHPNISAQSIFFSISFISCFAEMGLPVLFHRLERLIAGDDVYRLGAWKTLKCDSGVLDASHVATWDCDFFFSVVLCGCMCFF